MHKELDPVGIKPEHLAEAGFFPLLNALGEGVHSYQCFACAGKLSAFERGDNVFHDHAKFFPRCPMVIKIGSNHP